MDIFSIFSSAGNYLADAFASDLARQTFLFALAAWIHSGRVKKEIKSQFLDLTGAIHGVETKLGTVIDNLEVRVSDLEEKIKIK